MSGWKEKHRKLPRRARRRHRLQRVHVRRGRADLLEQDAAVRRADPARPQRAGDRVLRRDRDRPGLRRRARRRSSPKCSASTPFDVRCVTGDTGITPVDLGSYSSRVTVMMGNAAIQAAERLQRADRRRGCRDSSKTLPDRVVFSQGRVFAADKPSSGMTLRRSGGDAPKAKFGTLGAVGSYSPPRAPGQVQGRRRRPVARVLLHRLRGRGRGRRATGWIHVPKIWIAHDIGRAINPVLARGQVIGSVYMGLGEALMEEQVVPPPAGEAVRRAGAQDARRCSSTRASPRSTCPRSKSR